MELPEQDRTGPEKMKKNGNSGTGPDWTGKNEKKMEIPEPDRTGPDRSIHMKMGQNMTKFDENGSKYDEI